VNTIYLVQFHNKIVDLLIAATDKGIHRIGFADSQKVEEFSSILNSEKVITTRFPFPRLLINMQLYFQGEKVDFDEPLDLPEATGFQHLVWKRVKAIPYGCVVTYSQIAKGIGHANASRAVGGANGANPVPIIIPCHRVITSDGKLGGYSAGIHIKDRLLRLEGAVI
jgi:methylated-DNA-[protein]-cysteine S-methyltransferase